MAGTEKHKEAAQGAVSPESKQAGIQSEMEVGAKNPEQTSALLTAVDPEWAQSILDSNAAVISSNEAVLAGLEGFKQHAAEFVDKIAENAVSGSKEGQSPVAKVAAFDSELNYHVTAGKSFRDPKDFAREYTEGDEVTHLGETVLQRLLDQGLVGGLPKEEE